MGDDVLPFLKIPRFSLEVNLSMISFSFGGNFGSSSHSQPSCLDVFSTKLFSHSRVVPLPQDCPLLGMSGSRRALLGDGCSFVGFISICFGLSSGPSFIRMDRSG